jgi:hypothetical protein
MRHFFVAGFDFGTSYSKVVLRDQLTGVAKAVTFGSQASGLFPSFVRIDKGVLFGPECCEGKLILSYPKLIATDAASNGSNFTSLYGDSLAQVHRLLETQALQQVACFILVRYFVSVIDAIYQFISQDDEWLAFNPVTDPLVLQIAVPIGLSAKDNACDRMIQQALVVATHIREAAGRATSRLYIDDIQRAFLQVEKMDTQAREKFNNRCITYPEVAAGVHTILRSPNTPDGKYITMDVGAGTVDLNAFLRRRMDVGQTGRGLDYWACEVRPLGFARLNLGAAHRQQAHELSVNPLKESDLLDGLGNAVRDLMQAAFRYQPNRLRGPGDAPWSRQTFAYIWGGGAGHVAYEETFLEYLKSSGIGVHDVNRLPTPSDHFALPRDVDFGRLAIAYGLSFHKANLETVRLPSQLKTFDELYPDFWQEVIDTQKLCTCRGNPACLRCYGSGIIKPDESFAPRLDLGPTPRASTTPPKKSRIQLSLEHCIKSYGQIPRAPRPSFLIERFLLLDRIRVLRNHPAIQDGSLVQQRADSILLSNVAPFFGRVRILRFSAKTNGAGCQCVVARADRGVYEDVLIHAGQPHLLEEFVNSDSAGRHVDIICGIRRTERREFVLQLISLEVPPSRRRGRTV